MGRNGGKWTDARFKSFITSLLRSGTRRWQPKFEVLAEAKTKKKVNKKTKRMAQHYLCASCNQEHPASNVQIDHIIPVVSPSEGFTTWDSFIDGLFCEKENLQCLCIPCHKVKSEKERQQHASNRRRKS